MTVPEAAAALGVHRTRVWQYIRDGLLPGRKIGRDWVVTREAVQHLQDHRPARGRPRRAGAAAGSTEAGDG